MLLNKRGAALLQVLIVTAILAGMSTMILRLTLSRQLTSRKTRHTVSAQSVIESCMAEVNTLWAAKTPEVYAQDLKTCMMCANCEDNIYTCANVALDTQSYVVKAKMEQNTDANSASSPCRITYTIVDAMDKL